MSKLFGFIIFKYQINVNILLFTYLLGTVWCNIQNDFMIWIYLYDYLLYLDIIQGPSTPATTQERHRNLTRANLKETMQGVFLILGLKISHKPLRESPGTKIDSHVLFLCLFLFFIEMLVIIYIFKWSGF